MKKRIIYSIWIIALAWVGILPANAQKFNKEALIISNSTLWQEGNSLYVDMLIDVSNLSIDKDRTLTLTPLLIGAQNDRVLPAIIINGSRREKAYQRTLLLNKRTLPTLQSTGIQMPNGQTDVINYRQVIAYEAWMGNAALDMEVELCGCAGHQEELHQVLVTDEVSTELKRMSSIVPEIAYIEVDNVRSEQYEAHLDFPVGQSVILPNFMNNRSEMQNIQAMLDKIQQNKNLIIKEVRIEGFASPEGPLSLNEQLSQNRAEALKQYLSRNKNISANLYKVSFGGENWNGLIKALETSSLKEKDAFLKIIKETPDDAQRKQAIKQLDGGAPYRAMLKELYPPLRKSDCRIDYTIINIDVADITLTAYPEEEVVSLNAAAAALSKRDIESARKYLIQANKKTAEYKNNIGVLYFLEGDWKQAVIEFQKAADRGNRAAQTNLLRIQKQLDKKRNVGKYEQ